MHYRFAEREASLRKGRQIFATPQAAGWERTRSGRRTVTPCECETRGLNFSFAIKATSPFSLSQKHRSFLGLLSQATLPREGKIMQR